PNASVMAIADGKVNRFVHQPETDDYEIGVISTLDPAFSVVYDHVKNPTIGMGDTLVSGQVLGKPGNWGPTLGRFEIMINNDSTGRSYCPFVHFDPALKADYQAKVSTLMQDWENFKGNNAIYNEAAQVLPGCRYESMVNK
ncbi:MAG: M23 family metallopeptidase, partial [Gammaproteobacteria bacterium]|nr:M23 family metallopeptidase [Gammaproteobacteria bacterium]